jgi:hypothetical protein
MIFFLDSVQKLNNAATVSEIEKRIRDTTRNACDRNGGRKKRSDGKMIKRTVHISDSDDDISD